MKEANNFAMLSPERINELEKKLCIFLKEQKEYSVLEKYTAMIQYAKTLSDFNKEPPIDFLLNVIINTMTIEEYAEFLHKYPVPYDVPGKVK